MRVPNATIFNGNPYHRLIYSGVHDRFTPTKTTIGGAVSGLRDRQFAPVLHVHWEEQPLRKAETSTEAALVAEKCLSGLREFCDEGGKILWTVHNRLPHELEFVDELMRLREGLSKLSHRILVHHTEAMAALSHQVPTQASKFALFPHPSYAGVYPNEAPPRKASRRGMKELLVFGMLRRYKGLNLLMEAIGPDAFELGARVKIRGDVLKDDPYREEVEGFGRRRDVDLQIGRVADEDVAELFHNAWAAVLPYERVLTSGVAMLALTFGTPIVAPRTGMMCEVLPTAAHAFLFEHGNAESLRNALSAVCSLSAAERSALVKASRLRAADFHPVDASSWLGRIIDDCME